MAPAHVSRRVLLVTLAAAAGTGAVIEDADAKSGSAPTPPSAANIPQPITPGPPQYFTFEEIQFIDAAVSRLIPNDELGPGAKEAGVTIFIDRQLAGSFGKADSWYMQGPWADGASTQGYQTKQTPAQLYRAAIKAIENHCRQTFGGKTFAQLSAEQQDEMIRGLEKGEIKLSGADAKTFFTVFLQNTIEGFFSDPIYGGNRDMVGWKLIGFPGARYDYRPYVGKHGQKLELPPVGLKGRAAWNTQK